jgi:superfamily II DNA or RNA helicase
LRLRDLPLKAVYKSDHDNILRDFYIPAVSCSIKYDRAVGFFSASMLSYASQGLESFARNAGKMRLIVGAELEPEEHDAAVRGYVQREQIAEQLGKLFEPILTQVNADLFLKRLEALQWLVANDFLDIKVALRRKGMYHEKVGILTDSYGDFIVFQGSANESLYALSPDFNYESINVFRSWRANDQEHYEAHLSTFQELWEGRSKSTLVVDFPEFAKNALLRRQIPKRTDARTELELSDALLNFKRPNFVEGPSVPLDFSLFEHQRIALEKWRESDFSGIFNLATGAGKTYTAIYGATKIFEQMERLLVVVAVPYQALAEQWVTELKKFSIDPIVCSSANPDWTDVFGRDVDSFLIGKRKFVVAVVVNATLTSARFQQVIGRIKDGANFLFIGDECHYHGTPRLFAALPDNADLRMGLSATYRRQGDQDGTRRIEEYYGPVVATYTLVQAIDDGFLVPYHYHLQLVELNDSESNEYAEISDKIWKRLAALKSEDPEAALDNILETLFYKRARLLGRLESKRQRLAEIIDSTALTERTLVYCGEGAAGHGEEDDPSSEEILNIDLITKVISLRGYRVTKFTSRESLTDRQIALEGFRRGSIQVLTAIRCLDEGIDIPTCETAFILASSRNPRQFIQRRGRILRRSPGKTSATLWDFLPIPPASSLRSEKQEKALLQRELGRISEFSRQSRNFRETHDKLKTLLERYDLNADFLLGEEAI